MKTAELEVIGRDGPDVNSMERADTLAIWEDFRTKLDKLTATAETLTVTDATQKAEMKLARTTRLTLKDLRVAIEHKRKELKESYLRKSQKIDESARVLKDLIESLETRLLEQEQFAEREEAKRKAALKIEREAFLLPLGVNPDQYALAEMGEGDFDQLFSALDAAHLAKQEAARKAEAERIAKENADREERERIRLENERLKREAVEREAKARAEREELEKKARAEREAIEAKAREDRAAREKAEAELRAKELAEETAKNAKLAAERKAARAPDKAKLMAVSEAIIAISIAKMATPEGAKASVEIREAIDALLRLILAKANTL